MTSVLITRPLPNVVIERARGLFDIEVRTNTSPMSHAELLRSLQEFDGVLPTLRDNYSADIFAAVPEARCKILANFGVGYNHIDAKTAEDRGIVVTNTPGAVTDATADIGLMLILMSGRRACEGERMVRANQWGGLAPDPDVGPTRQR